MEREGKIKVESHSRTRKGTYLDGTLIQFL